jgi:hypothetical protein
MVFTNNFASKSGAMLSNGLSGKADYINELTPYFTPPLIYFTLILQQNWLRIKLLL